ncbi:60S ribosomal protein L44 Q [Balamuthia mandrillaris]
MQVALKKGKNVIIDRCNFDYQQRHNWIKFAHKFGYQIEIAWLDLPPEICKQRVFVRKDHPTIQEGDSGFAIIDRFASMLTAPMKAEGFSRIYLLHTEEEVNQFAETGLFLVGYGKEGKVELLVNLYSSVVVPALFLIVFLLLGFTVGRSSQLWLMGVLLSFSSRLRYF